MIVPAVSPVTGEARESREIQVGGRETWRMEENAWRQIIEEEQEGVEEKKTKKKKGKKEEEKEGMEV